MASAHVLTHSQSLSNPKGFQNYLATASKKLCKGCLGHKDRDRDNEPDKEQQLTCNDRHPEFSCNLNKKMEKSAEFRQKVS